jgi:hypothetical protein
MHTLLTRYLDGGLNEEEARAFQVLLANDPALARELKEIEFSGERFTAARFCPDGGAVDRIMGALPAVHPVVRRRRLRVTRTLAMAATVVLCVGLGWVAGRQGGGATGAGDLAQAPTLAVVTGGPAAGRTATAVRWVRLVHVPTDPATTQVAVAGDFNGWDPAATPMTRHGDAWVAWLALPVAEYEYQFVEDGGARRVADPLATTTRDDGFGGVNAVLNLEL